LNQILRRQTSRSHYGSKVPAVTVTVFKYRNKIGKIVVKAVPMNLENGGFHIKTYNKASQSYEKQLFTSLFKYDSFVMFQNSSTIRGIYVGHEAKTEIIRDRLDAQYPIENGIVSDWDAMEALLHHVFDVELKSDSEKHDVLLVEPPHNPKKNREKMAQLMFETFNVGGVYLGSFNVGGVYLGSFNVGGVYLGSSAVLSLYSIRRMSGLVLSSGEAITHCVPVYDGAELPQSTLQLDLAGKEITDFLGTLLGERGYTFPSVMDKETHTREMKEKFIYVAEDFAEEMASPIREEKYKLPDNTVVKLGKERFKCTEALFQPYLAGKETVGIHKYVYQSIMKCDTDLQDEMYGIILLAGGSTLFPYFPSRLQREVTLLSPANTTVNVIARPDRQDAAWIGGSILSEMSTFEHMLILREDYDEYGPSIVRRKC
jgi:actin-related protein